MYKWTNFRFLPPHPFTIHLKFVRLFIANEEILLFGCLGVKNDRQVLMLQDLWVEVARLVFDWSIFYIVSAYDEKFILIPSLYLLSFDIKF